MDPEGVVGGEVLQPPVQPGLELAVLPEQAADQVLVVLLDGGGGVRQGLRCHQNRYTYSAEGPVLSPEAEEAEGGEKGHPHQAQEDEVGDGLPRQAIEPEDQHPQKGAQKSRRRGEPVGRQPGQKKDSRFVPSHFTR